MDKLNVNFSEDGSFFFFLVGGGGENPKGLKYSLQATQYIEFSLKKLCLTWVGLR